MAKESEPVEITSKEAISERTIGGTVARGRSLLIPDPVERRQVGWIGDTGKPVFASVLHELLPGDTFTGPVAEVKRLRAQGYLIDPEAIAPADLADAR